MQLLVKYMVIENASTYHQLVMLHMDLKLGEGTRPLVWSGDSAVELKDLMSREGIEMLHNQLKHRIHLLMRLACVLLHLENRSLVLQL